MDINEDGPVNAVGGGAIAGVGIGAQGEPGVMPAALNRYKRKNQQQAPSPVLGNMQKRMTFKDFVLNRGDNV